MKETKPLFELTAEDLRDLLYTKAVDQGPNHYRPPVYKVKLNQFPTLLPIQGLLPADAKRLRFDEAKYTENLRRLAHLQKLKDKISPILDGNDFERLNLDVDEQLYDGFYKWHDKNLLRKIRASNGNLESLP